MSKTSHRVKKVSHQHAYSSPCSVQQRDGRMKIVLIAHKKQTQCVLFRSPPVVPVLYDKIDTHYISEQQQDEHRHEAGYPDRIMRMPDHHDADQYCQTRLLIKDQALGGAYSN